MKKNTFNILFYPNTSKQKKNGMCPLMGRITVNSKIAQFSLKMDIIPKNWDVERKKVSKRNKESLMINRKIEETEQKIMEIHQRLVSTNGYATAGQIKNSLMGKDDYADAILKLFNAHNAEFEKRIEIDRSKNTLYTYKQVYGHLSDFIKSKYGIDDYPLKRIETYFFRDFENYLKDKHQFKQSSIHKYIYSLMKIIVIAKSRGLINPGKLNGYSCKKGEKRYRHLTGAELEKLMSTQIDNPKLCFVRDMFIFSVFTGLSYIDLFMLDSQNIKKESDGSLWIYIKRQKTEVESCVRMLDIPIKIIEKYNGERKSSRIFNIPANQGIVKALRKIEKLCGIEHLNFHQGRHSFASLICMRHGVPIETISKMMGHKSIQTTQIYAEITNQKIDADMKILSKRLNWRNKKTKEYSLSCMQGLS